MTDEKSKRAISEIHRLGDALLCLAADLQENDWELQGIDTLDVHMEASQGEKLVQDYDSIAVHNTPTQVSITGNIDMVWRRKKT